MTPSIGNLPEDVSVAYNPDEDAPAGAVETVKRRHEAKLLQTPGVIGVGIGRSAIGDEAIVVYVRESATAKRLPKSIDGIEIVTEVTGEIDAY